MDQMVLMTQQWLNETYEGRTGWTPIPETGVTGWTTVYALLHAFQIENGSTEPSDNIGPWTISKLQEVGNLERDDDANPTNLVKILQGTLWCKGYPADGMNGVFGEQTEAGIKSLQEDIGLINPNGKTDLYLWYALFSMQQFVLLSGGNEKIRQFQQNFNRNFKEYYGTYVPCDGLSGRELFTCFILLLQMEEGYSSEEANGNFGPSTSSHCPTLSIGDTSYPETVKCLKMALYINGFPEDDFDTSSIIDEEMMNNIHAFNDFMALPDESNTITPGTIKSLYISCGDTERDCAAIDTAYPLNNPSRLGMMINHGIRCVGRYITPGIIGTEDKMIDRDELADLKSANITTAPIYQSTANELSYFTKEQGQQDGNTAYYWATQMSLPKNTIIYFAVDYDVLGADIPGTVIPYFEGVNKSLRNKGVYRVGVYGTRNVCNQVSDAGLAVTSYVADMSYLYSGNMGFPMPKNWSFDQFANTTFSMPGTTDTLEVDKVAMRFVDGADLGVYMEDDEITALRCMAEDALDAFGLRPLLMNGQLEIGVPVKLITTPIEVELIVSSTLSSNIENPDYTITASFNTDGSITSELQNEITNISGSLELDEEEKENVSTSLETLVKKYPDGTEFSFNIGYETDGNIVISLVINVPEAYEYYNQTYGGSVELEVKIPLSSLGSGSEFDPNKIEELTFSEMVAVAVSSLYNIGLNIDYQVINNNIVISVVVVVLFAVFYRLALLFTSILLA